MILIGPQSRKTLACRLKQTTFARGQRGLRLNKGARDRRSEDEPILFHRTRQGGAESLLSRFQFLQSTSGLTYDALLFGQGRQRERHVREPAHAQMLDPNPPRHISECSTLDHVSKDD